MRPSLRQLEYLIALEKTASFSAAAELCHVTQSTLSAGIKELELILGDTLVNRHRRNIHLTALGKDICADAKDILARTDRLTAKAEKSQAPLSGTLRLGIIPTIAPYLIPRILPGLQEQFPNLALELHEDLSAHLVDKAIAGDLDVIILALPYDLKGLTRHTLFAEDFYLACPQNHVLASQQPNKNDLDPDELLLLEDGHCLRDHILAACKIQNTVQKKSFSAASLQTLLQLVRHGYGITLLPAMMLEGNVMPADVIIQRFQNPAPQREIGIAWLKNAPKAHDYELLARTIKELQKT